MIEKKVKIVNKYGLHMRPGMMLTELAESFDSDITIIKDSIKANGKSIMSVTMLAVLVNDEIIIRAEGSDENEAIDSIVKLIKNKFSEILSEK